MQRIFITGASSGLGAALARHYAREGAELGLAGRRKEALESLRDSLPAAASAPSSGAASHALHRLYVLDVNDHAALAAAAADFLSAGGIDIVIASAGISQGTLTEYAEDTEVFARILATNVTATVATFAPFIGTMKRQARENGGSDRHGQRSRLVGIGSVAGIRGLPGAGAYSASKAAVIAYCESLRLELRADGIKVVTIAPGYIDTPMTRVNQYSMPFLMPAERFAARAAAAIAAGASYRVIPWQMGLVARLLRLLPNWLYDLAFANAPRKARKEP